MNGLLDAGCICMIKVAGLMFWHDFDNNTLLRII